MIGGTVMMIERSAREHAEISRLRRMQRGISMNLDKRL